MFKLYAGALFLIAVAYVFSIGYLDRYLQRVHPEIWRSIGQPTRFVDQTGGWQFLSLRFIFFSNRYKGIEDPKLTGLIWLVRILAGLATVSVVGVFLIKYLVENSG